VPTGVHHQQRTAGHIRDEAVGNQRQRHLIGDDAGTRGMSRRAAAAVEQAIWVPGSSPDWACTTVMTMIARLASAVAAHSSQMGPSTA
jgi:hypothetical protein